METALLIILLVFIAQFIGTFTATSSLFIFTLTAFIFLPPEQVAIVSSFIFAIDNFIKLTTIKIRSELVSKGTMLYVGFGAAIPYFILKVYFPDIKTDLMFYTFTLLALSIILIQNFKRDLIHDAFSRVPRLLKGFISGIIGFFVGSSTVLNSSILIAKPLMQYHYLATAVLVALIIDTPILFQKVMHGDFFKGFEWFFLIIPVISYISSLISKNVLEIVSEEMYPKIVLATLTAILITNLAVHTLR